MSDPIKVRIPSRGVTLTFPADAKPEDIEQVIAQDYPRNGQDVAYDLAQDPGYAERMTLKEYEDLRLFKKQNPATSDLIWQGLKGAINEIGTGLEKGAQAVKNLEFAKAGEAVAKGALVGAGDLGDLFNRAIVWDQAPDTYEDFRAGWEHSPELRAQYEKKLKADFEEFKILQFWQADRKKIVESSPIPEVTQATSYVADPSLVLPGIGEVTGASKLAAKGVGYATKGLGTASRVVTEPLADVAKAAARSENEIVRGISNLASPASAVVRGADDIARAATVAGDNLISSPTRVGALESLGRQLEPTRVDRALAAVGRYGGDRVVKNALATATGAVEGAAIGGALGAVAEGQEGFFSGLGTGLALGAFGGSAGNAYYQLSGQARIDAALADFNRFRDNLDAQTRAKLDTVAERDGLDSVVRLMDGAGLLRGQFKDAEVNFLSGDEFKAKYQGADARGVQIIEAAKPVIDINVDHKRSDYTFGHEIFHALEQVEQLRPQMERIKQEIVGAWVTNPDGTVTQAQAGFLSPAEVEIRHKQYMRKLAQSGASRDVRPWFEDKTIGQKARRVAGELGAEYMARLITGSDPDALLRGFDGITRQIADYTLTKASNETIRGIAERLGTGARPVESILFKDLKNAPPVVTAALRDVLRARKEMNKRIKLIDRSDRGLVLTPRDLSNQAAAEIAVRAGVAVKDPSGAVRMRTDDELTKLEDDQANAIRKIVDSTPIEDPTKPHMRSVDGNIYTEGGVSPEQLKAFLAEPTLTNKVKEALGFVAEGLSNLYSGKGATVFRVEYGPALTKKTHPITRKKRNAYSSGIRLTQRDIAIFGLKFNKGDVPYIKLLDVSKLMSFAADRASSGNLGPYGRDFDGFTTDIVQYFENASDPTSKTHTVDLPGMTPEKARFLNEFFGSKDGTDSVFIRDFRLDRITEIRPTNQRIAASELAWQRQKSYWMPAQKVGDGQVVKSAEGYSIINKGANWHLYAPDGQRIGIYETQANAEVATNQFIARTPDDYSETKVASDNTVPGTPAPDSPVRDIPLTGRPINWQSSEVNYQPTVLPEAYKQMTPELLAEIERISPTIAAIHIDRMRVGSYKGTDLQGGFFYPAIVENLKNRVVWAFNGEGVARTVARRAAQNNGLVKLVLMQEGNVVGNKTFANVWFKDLRENIAAGKITERRALEQLNSVRHRWARDPQWGTGHVRRWNNLDEAEKAITSLPQMTRASTYFKKSRTTTKAEGEKIAYQSLLAQKMTEVGFPDAIQLVRDLEEPAFKGVPQGAIVGILRFDPVPDDAPIKTATEAGVPEHYSYKYVLHGEPVAKVAHYNVLDAKFPEVKNKILSQQHTDFPVREAIPADREMAMGEINFQPADLPVVRQAIARRRTKKESETDITLGELMDRLDDDRSHGDEYIASVAHNLVKDFRQRRVPRNILLTDEERKVIEAEVLRRAEIMEKDEDNTIDVQATSVQPKLLFQPAQKLPHGNVWRGENGLTIVQKDGGNYRVYSPLGLLGVAASYEKAQQLVNRRAR